MSGGGATVPRQYLEESEVTQYGNRCCPPFDMFVSVRAYH